MAKSKAVSKRKSKPGSFGARVSEELAKPENADIAGEAQTDSPVANALALDVPSQVKTVRGSLMFANYLEPKFAADKEGEKLLTLHVSMPLVPEHQDVLPKKILEAWDFLAESEDKLHIVQGIRPHTCEFFLAPDDSEPLFTATQATMRAVKLVFVQQKGSGKTVKFIRLSFGLEIEASDDPKGWATSHFGAQYWLSLFEKQGKLKLGRGA
jgi:hypothetical protein